MAAGDPLVAAVHGCALRLADPFESILGHEFIRPELLREAMTHRSVAHGQPRKGAPPRAASNEQARPGRQKRSRRSIMRLLPGAAILRGGA